MTITVYGIRNCDTVKRARKALDAAGVAYDFHDFRVDGLDSATAGRWIDALGIDTVLNRRGTTWRQLSEAQRARVDGDAAALLAENPTLIKRPVFDRDGAVRVGFAAAGAEDCLAWLAGEA